MSKRFIKTKEDFICERCGKKVIGNGYTNHCPSCLWSKHVDINPGDRAQECQGSMRPIGIELRNSQLFILHKCEKCGFERKNKKQDNDDFDTVLKLSAL